jgi:hypothetical protein
MPHARLTWRTSSLATPHGMTPSRFLLRPELLTRLSSLPVGRDVVQCI